MVNDLKSIQKTIVIGKIVDITIDNNKTLGKNIFFQKQEKNPAYFFIIYANKSLL